MLNEFYRIALRKVVYAGRSTRSGGRRLRRWCAFDCRGSVFEGNTLQKPIDFLGTADLPPGLLGRFNPLEGHSEAGRA